MLVVTELTAYYYTSQFISKFGCKEYFDHNKNLLFFERHQEITRQIEIWSFYNLLTRCNTNSREALCTCIISIFNRLSVYSIHRVQIC